MATKSQIPVLVVLSLVAASPSPGREKLWPEDVDAIIVLDENKFQVKNQNKATFKKHRLVYIYNDAGKKYGNVTVYENKFMKCKNIIGRITDLDGNLIRELGKDDIQKTAHFPEFVLYEDSKYYWFQLGLSTFPYVVEYSYEVDYNTLFFWPNWYPQKDIPVLKSSYQLDTGGRIQYRTHAIGIEIEPQSAEKSTWVWQLENIKPRVKERFMPPENNVQMALYFASTRFKIGNYGGSFASWDGLAEWYNDLSSGRYELPPGAKAQVLKQIDETDTHRQKVQKLYAFMQDHTRYVAIELGIGGWQPYSAVSTFKNRYGDCKDLSTFMISMLKEVGITAYPALTRTRNRGALVREFPSNQFNHCITVVPLQRDTLWLECTADLLAADMLPADVEGCDVLVVKENAGEIVRTPQSQYGDNVSVSKIEGSVTPSGAFTFSGEIMATGNISAYLRGKLYGRKPEDRKQWLRKSLGRYLPKLDLIEYEIDRLDRDFEKPVIIRFKGALNKFGVRSAKRLFINPNILNRLTPDDLPREKKRRFPIHHRYAFIKVDSLSISIPAGFELEAALDPEKTATPFGHFETAYAFTDGKLTYSRTFRRELTHIPLSMYGAYVSFLKKIVKKDQSPFVFKRVQG